MSDAAEGKSLVRCKEELAQSKKLLRIIFLSLHDTAMLFESYARPAVFILPDYINKSGIMKMSLMEMSEPRCLNFLFTKGKHALSKTLNL